MVVDDLGSKTADSSAYIHQFNFAKRNN